MLLGLDPGQSDCGAGLLKARKLVAGAWLQAPHKLPNDPKGLRAMAEIVKNTARLSDEDRRAIAMYLRSVPANPLPEKR